MRMAEVWVPLGDLAHGRSGDKGDMVNIAIISRQPEWYDMLRDSLTTTWLESVWSGMATGPFEVHEVPGVHALNCLLFGALQGGGTVALRKDAQGKAMGQVIQTARLPFDLDSARHVGIPLENATLDMEGKEPLEVVA